METKAKWVFDKAHTGIGFKVKHLMISNVKGSFSKYDAEILTEGNDFTTATIKFRMEAGSVDTANADRDKHLKSPDFFDAEKYKDITFTSTSLKKADDENYKLTGDLTIKGISKNVTLNVEFGGVVKDPWGNEKAGIMLTGKVYRKDWDLNWNVPLEAGGVLVGEEVSINIEAELQKVKE
ncbi:MAG: YceI family protein [Bacteroidota bacterium]|nr:YceI family protein [Bacteroidota bacterium]